MARLATRQGGPRQTKVARMPFWITDDPSDTSLESGEWRFLPVGKTHQQLVSQGDPDDPDFPAFTQGQYEAKGWIPLTRIPKGDPRRQLLPTNYRDVMRDHKALPIMPTAVGEKVSGK